MRAGDLQPTEDDLDHFDHGDDADRQQRPPRTARSLVEDGHDQQRDRDRDEQVGVDAVHGPESGRSTEETGREAGLADGERHQDRRADLQRDQERGTPGSGWGHGAIMGYSGLGRSVRRGSINRVTSRAAEAQRLRDLALLRRVRDRIDREYAQPLDVEALARGVNLSAGHLSREFKKAYGEAPYGYLMTRRIERAMALLRRGDLTVTEVCFTVGCSSLGTFSTRFTELVGVPPSTYRRRAGQGDRRACRHAWRNRSPDRSGIEKHGSGSRS